jgi:ribosomal protein L40E
MIGEGIDIPRLRVLCYLPKAMTELAFRQALGRIVRNYGPQDDTRGYVVMPESAIFKNYARRVEEEMSPALRRSAESPDYKICRICSAENPLSANICHDCDTEFPAARARLKTCEHCGAFNSLSADTCQDCGILFGHDFTLRLNSALRVGGIVRGGDYEEIEFQQGEGIADDFRTLAVRSGDEFILKMTRVAPDESLGRLSAFFDEIKRSRASK